jgi:hypothetical protein
MKLRWTILGLGAACVACCVPLILPLLGGFGLGGAALSAFAGKVSLDQLICLGLPMAIILVAGLIWMRRRQHLKSSCACPDRCDVEACSPAADR